MHFPHHEALGLEDGDVVGLATNRLQGVPPGIVWSGGVTSRISRTMDGRRYVGCCANETRMSRKPTKLVCVMRRSIHAGMPVQSSWEPTVSESEALYDYTIGHHKVNSSCHWEFKVELEL